MSQANPQLAALSPQEKRAMLARLLREKAQKASPYFPLSYVQRTTWIHMQVQPEMAVFAVPVAARIRAPLDVAALGRAIQALADRHTILRTTYTVRDGEPVQQVHDRLEIPLGTWDASAWSDAELDARMNEEFHRPFDLARGPVLRAGLFSREPRDHFLLLIVHHIAVDFWSIDIIIDELRRLYAAAATGQPARLPPVRCQYTDYVAWQSTMLKGPEGKRLWAYWKKRLGGELPVLELPTDRPRPHFRSFGGSARRYAVDAQLLKQLKQLALQEGTTLYTLFLAALQALLSRYTGQDDIVTGVPTAGRSRPEFEGTVGFLADGVVIRSDLSGNPPFRELLGRVRQTVLEGLMHQDFPGALLEERLAIPWDPSHPHITQVAFGWDKPQRMEPAQNGHAPAVGELPLEELVDSSFGMRYPVALSDLMIIAIDTGTALSLLFQYNTDLFEPATIARMVGHFQTLLEGIAADPDQPIGQLPLLRPDERRQLLREWNDTHLDVPDGCVHQLFEAQAARTPDAVALVYGEQQLTYGELSDRAARLASRLRALGVGPGQLVGVYMDRSPDLVAGLMAILKAGGAYVPLDPASPPERLQFIGKDAGIQVLLTQRHLAGSWPDQACRLVFPDAVAEPGLPACSAPSAVAPSDLAYVIYTSGSTGQPKGVLVEHRNAVNLIASFIHSYATAPGDRMLQQTSLTFDVSVGEIFPVLCAGGTLVLLDAADSRDLDQLVACVARHRVTMLGAVPSLLARLNERQADLPSLRLVLSGGEALSTTDIDRLQEAATVTNGYGPTETTVCSTYYRLPRRTRTEVRKRVPIGKPVANTRVYILDRQGQLVPAGVPGELYIGGAGVARGYLNRPELTAERFIIDPFVDRPGARMYRTGDRARWLPDGNIEFLGRIDQQVKVRGFRIEPGEIETALATHPAVAQAAVVAQEEHSGSKCLVAFLVARAEQTIAPAEVRTFLRGKLPYYMVPSRLVIVPALPMTLGGKVDYRALSAPEPDRAAAVPVVAPRTPVEELVMEVWSALLRVPRISVHDNFIDLGGHSLLAAQVITRLRDVFQVALPVHVLFEAPTVAELALQIELAMQRQEGPQAPPLEPLPRDRPVPLAHSQRMFWVLDCVAPGNPANNIPAAVRVRGLLDLPALQRSVNEVVRRHESLRTTFATVDGQPVQVIAPERTIALAVVDLSHLPIDEQQTEVRRRTAEEADRPFDLGRGPLLRMMLLRLGEMEHVAVLCMHHIIADGWSLAIFIQEMLTLYEAFRTASRSPLPALRIQYADYARWQEDWFQGDVVGRQLAWWKQRLAGCTFAATLPTDHPRPVGVSYRGAQEMFRLPPALTGAIKDLGRREGATLFMTLLAALKILLQRWTGHDDVVVGTPVAGRHRRELEGLIGAFVNMLALRTDLGGAPTFRELLRRVRETALGAYAHQDLPLDVLVRALRPGSGLAQAPLFQVILNVQWPVTLGQHYPGGLTVEPLNIERNTEATDLSWSLTDTEEGLLGFVGYNRDLFEPATIRRLVGHFQDLLGAITANPDQSIARLPVLVPDQGNRKPVVQDRPVPPPPTADRVLPVTATEQRLAALFAAVLRTDQVNIHDSFFEIGGHSLLAVELVHRIGQTFGIDFPLSTLLHTATVAGLALILDQLQGSAAVSLVPLRREGSKPPLFFLHSAGGHLLSYQPLTALLGPDQPVYGLQSRAVTPGVAEHASIEGMAADYAQQIRAVQPNGPFHLLGHSMGGILALAVAEVLEREGLVVKLVGMLDPILPDETQPVEFSVTPLLAMVRQAQTGTLGPAMTFLGRAFSDWSSARPNGLSAGVPPEAMMEQVLDVMEKTGLSLGASRDLFRHYMVLFGRHAGLLRAFKPGNVRAPLTIWWAREVVPGMGTIRPAWREHTLGPCREQGVTGNHFTMLYPPNVEELARSIVSAEERDR